MKAFRFELKIEYSIYTVITFLTTLSLNFIYFIYIVKFLYSTPPTEGLRFVFKFTYPEDYFNTFTPWI